MADNTDPRTNEQILADLDLKLSILQARKDEQTMKMIRLLLEVHHAFIGDQINPFDPLIDKLLQELEAFKNETDIWDPNHENVHYWIDQVIDDVTSHRRLASR